MDEKLTDKKLMLIMVVLSIITIITLIIYIKDKETIKTDVLDEVCKEQLNNTDAVFVEQDGVATKLECEILEDKNGKFVLIGGENE